VQRQRGARAVRVDGARQRQVEAHIGLRPEGNALPPAAVHVQPQAPVRPALDPARPARTASAAAAGLALRAMRPEGADQVQGSGSDVHAHML